MKYLSVCCILRNEALYLDEWIAFHAVQGVEHFFLYENESTDETWEKLMHYEALGIATIQKIPTDPVNTQRVAYSSCLKDHGKESKWIAFLDCDEFLMADGVSGSLREELKDYEEHGAVAVNWILYGSAGEEHYSDKLVIERFTHRAKNVDQHVKSIVQPEFTIGTGNNAHYFRLKKPAVNENKEVLPPEYYWTTPTAKKFRINHYHVKSREEYFKRKAYMDVDGVNRGSIEDRFRGHDVSEVFDVTACAHLSEIENFMEKLK